MVESLEEAVEDLLPADLSFVVGVVSLGLQGGSELDGGDEEGAGFADRFVVAVEFGRAGAVAVAEHPALVFGAEFAHLFGLVGGR